MQAKQNIKAQFTTENGNAINHGDKKEKISQYLIIDKTSERRIVDCRVYMGRGSSVSVVFASIWVNIKDMNKPKTWQYASTSGTGSAGGYGYHKPSAAVQEALTSAGIEFHARDKTRHYIDGVGDSAIRSALLAVAYSAGYNNVIFVSC